jgi:hypothetical protein
MAFFAGFVVGGAFTISGAVLLGSWLAQRRLRRILAHLVDLSSTSVADEVQAWLRDRR